MSNFKLEIMKKFYTKKLKKAERYYEIIDSGNTTAKDYALANYSGQILQIEVVLSEINKLIKTDIGE